MMYLFITFMGYSVCHPGRMQVPWFVLVLTFFPEPRTVSIPSICSVNIWGVNERGVT